MHESDKNSKREMFEFTWNLSAHRSTASDVYEQNEKSLKLNTESKKTETTKLMYTNLRSEDL